MNPLFFGNSERRLFGIYEPAAPGHISKRAAILCYPSGEEYIYAHRTLRQLALKLTSAGFHVLRFDFYGTGDSGGEMADATLASWEGDLKAAIDELMEITGLTKVCLIGMRLGSAVAAGVASQLSEVVEALVLWDPIVDGPEYLQPLHTNDNLAQESHDLFMTERMLREVEQLDLSQLILKHPSRTLILITEELPSQQRFMTTIAGLESFSVEHLNDVHPWLAKSAESGLVPTLAVQKILNWLK